MTVSDAVYSLADYAVSKGLASPCDKVYIVNSILSIMELDSIPPQGKVEKSGLTEILKVLGDDAVGRGIISQDTVTRRDLFDTKLMGAVTPWPSYIIEKFFSLPPKEATDWFYALSKDCNYIRTDRIKKNIYWQTQTEYAKMEITINLSKPEKDPRDIAAAAKASSAGYPKCLLCHENEGYAGNLAHPARQNLRLIPFKLCGEDWFMQYSPYSYYNEHCILLNGEHVPMTVSKRSMRRLAEFVTLMPHYFIGSNADLPIVGGSILSHDHFQGGRHVFPMEAAEEKLQLGIDKKGVVGSAIVNWPMSVIRLRSDDRDRLVDVAGAVLESWRGYSDAAAGIIAMDDMGPHNTVTPIFRRRGKLYEADLVLRNNRTDALHPTGIFHPHADKHHIKKENIGLIEVMGLAILPARLKDELRILREAMLTGKDISADERIASHAEWADGILSRRSDFCVENAEEILRQEVGKVFTHVLEDAGVYKHTPDGLESFKKFANSIGGF